jgi:hypothetical protein
MMVNVRWHDAEFEREVLNPAVVKLLDRIGIRGVSIAKQVISGSPDTELKAVDTGRLRASLAYEVDASKLLVRIGTNVKYAIFVFLGTVKMAARPVLRTMLHILRGELK